MQRHREWGCSMRKWQLSRAKSELGDAFTSNFRFSIMVSRSGGNTGSASNQQSTNDRKVAGSRPTKVMCITVLTGNRMRWTARCGRPPLLPSCRKLEFRLSALMDSDLAWVNDKSGRQSWRYADAFQRSIISEAIYHLPFYHFSLTLQSWTWANFARSKKAAATSD